MTDDELFLSAILNCKRSELYLKPIELDEAQKALYVDMQRRREAGEPVQYITGFTEFMGHRIDLSPDVLIPRPETEVLVDTLIQELKAKGASEHFILDIGTGSGCIPVALVKELKNCRAVGVDISDEAITQAEKNVAWHDLYDRINLVKRDVFWFMDETLDRFDAVISNPPYIPSAMMMTLPADVKQEPELALDGGPDGLHFYRYIIPTAWRVLKSGGLLALEFGDGQHKAIEKLFDQTGGWDTIRVVRDNNNRNRIIIAHKRQVRS